MLLSDKINRGTLRTVPADVHHLWDLLNSRLGLGYLLSPGLLALFLLFCAAFAGRQNHQHRAPFHLRGGFDHGYIGQRLGDLFQIFECDLGVIHFAAAELDGHANLMPLLQPAAGIIYFEAAMSLVRFGPQPDFFDFDLGLGPFGLTILLRPLINELSKVHHTADGRIGIRRNLHKVQLGIAGNLQGLADRHNTNVAAIRPDQSDFRNPDALIYSKI